MSEVKRQMSKDSVIFISEKKVKGQTS